MTILEINKKMVGKKVYCLCYGGFNGIVDSVKDEKTFIIWRGNELVEVDIFDIRNYEQ